MGDKIVNDKFDQVQTTAKCAIGAGLCSTPLWLQTASNYFDVVLFLIGAGVGLTTIWLNIIKIRSEKGKK